MRKIFSSARVKVTPRFYFQSNLQLIFVQREHEIYHGTVSYLYDIVFAISHRFCPAIPCGIVNFSKSVRKSHAWKSRSRWPAKLKRKRFLYVVF